MDYLYRAADPSRLNLNHSGYLAHVHPLELWLLTYLQLHPNSTWSDVRAASTSDRQEVYRWLFTTRSKGRRLAHGLALGDGRTLTVGGKTGTGDNRSRAEGRRDTVRSS